jgi:hypothetical protein
MFLYYAANSTVISSIAFLITFIKLFEDFVDTCIYHQTSCDIPEDTPLRLGKYQMLPLDATSRDLTEFKIFNVP